MSDDTLRLNRNWDGEGSDLLTEIGYACQKGTVFEQNYELAAQFYTLAGERGDAQAISNLGWLYENGLRFERDV